MPSTENTNTTTYTNTYARQNPYTKEKIHFSHIFSSTLFFFLPENRDRVSARARHRHCVHVFPEISLFLYFNLMCVAGTRGFPQTAHFLAYTREKKITNDDMYARETFFIWRIERAKRERKYKHNHRNRRIHPNTIQIIHIRLRHMHCTHDKHFAARWWHHRVWEKRKKISTKKKEENNRYM